MCWCGSAATCVARIDENGEMVTEGSQVQIGGNDMYTSVCRKHHKLGIVRKPE